MSRILDPSGRQVDSRGQRSILYGICLNMESGSAEIFGNKVLIERIPLAERKRLAQELIRDIPLAFKVNIQDA
jgi:hypothetical protein